MLMHGKDLQNKVCITFNRYVYLLSYRMVHIFYFSYAQSSMCIIYTYWYYSEPYHFSVTLCSVIDSYLLFRLLALCDNAYFLYLYIHMYVCI